MADSGVTQLRDLSARLKAAGREGGGLKRDLQAAIDRATAPLAKELGQPEYMKPYMPNRYADVLAADLEVTTQKRLGVNPGVTIRARGREHNRRLKNLNNRGILRHPVFGERGTPRRDWTWRTQLKGVHPRFFSDKVRQAAPGIRDEIVKAMHATALKITKG